MEVVAKLNFYSARVEVEQAKASPINYARPVGRLANLSDAFKLTLELFEV
jgi:hypothetical protein